MTHEILISVQGGIARIAHIEDGALARLEAAPLEAVNPVGDVHFGVVERVMPRLQAAFVDIGTARAGFLPARGAHALVPEADRNTPIEECVEDGDTLLVQITRPPRGDKGAQLTADITLPGRGLVIAPCRSRIAVSRQIESDKERDRLAALVADIREQNDISAEGADGDAGWVVRTAAAAMETDTLTADMRHIAAQWERLMAAADTADTPTLLHRDMGAVARVLRDNARADTARIVIEGAAAFEAAEAYCRDFAPDLQDKLAASEAGETLFDRHDVELSLIHI